MLFRIYLKLPLSFYYYPANNYSFISSFKANYCFILFGILQCFFYSKNLMIVYPTLVISQLLLSHTVGINTSIASFVFLTIIWKNLREFFILNYILLVLREVGTVLGVLMPTWIYRKLIWRFVVEIFYVLFFVFFFFLFVFFFF